MLRSVIVAAVVAGAPLGGTGGDVPVLRLPARPHLFTCGGDLAFTRAAMRSPTGAEKGSDPAAVALRRHLDRERRLFPGDPLPIRRAWRRVAAAPGEVEFGWAVRPGRVTREVTIALRRGRWRARTFGDCHPRLYAHGFETQPIRLRRSPNPRSRILRLWLGDGGCVPHPGRDLRRRIDHVEYARTPRGIRLVGFVRRPEGNCAGVGLASPIDVRLPDGSLGHAKIWDAGAAPATLVAGP
jgi:hypothetical protein